MGRGGALVAIPIVPPMSSTPTAHLPRLGPISGRHQAAHSTPASFSIQAWGPAAAMRPIFTDHQSGPGREAHAMRGSIERWMEKPVAVRAHIQQRGNCLRELYVGGEKCAKSRALGELSRSAMI
jgi:hypothetical protein